MTLTLDLFARKYLCLVAALTIGCGPGKSDTGDDDGTTGASGASTTDTPTGDGPPQDVCATGTAKTQVAIDFGVPVVPCEDEICSDERKGPCTVSAITSEGPTEVTLACDYEDLGPATAVLTLGLEPDDTLDLEVGAAVQLSYDSSSGFEVGGSSYLRITDDRGLVLGRGDIQRYGGLSGGTQWAEDYLTGLALPLTATIASAGCPDDENLSVITVARDESSVTVAQGTTGLLASGDAWRVVVETASIRHDEIEEGDVRLTIVRVEQ
ncbi:MAG TPA: hypothetical protein VGB85_21710 [Nannocystis sp.]|jgi:hypothetical protein